MLLADPINQQQPTVHGQASITVGHEDLRTVEDLDISTAPGGPRYVNNRWLRVTNLLAEYS